jgi:hypothetical protein
MSNFSRSKLFWSGTEGRNAARVAAKQADEQLQARMARERIEARYKELRERAERRGDPVGTQAIREDMDGSRTGEAA